jgi:hypothetical protein
MSDEMIETECGWVRDSIPDFARSMLPFEGAARVERHVAVCSECRSELELVQVLLASRPSVPAGLLHRIERGAVADRRAPTRTWWGVSAAAIAALALDIGIGSDSAPTTTGDVPGFAYEAEEGDIWLSDDGLLAGAPALGDLSDEALLELLDELTTGSGGGAA